MSLRDFDFLKELGSGAFGSVSLVKRRQDGEVYALKRVKFIQLSPKERDSALNEVRLLAYLNNINIIGYKEAFYDEQSRSLNIVMEFADDGDLASKVMKNKHLKKIFDENTIWNWLIQILYGLQYLHKHKVIHRDLKCANLFLTKDGIVKIGDLNVSKISELGMAKTQTGTPYYAAPEIWTGQQYDYKCDIWSIGVIIYELATLFPPFRGNSLKELSNNIMKGRYDQILLKTYSNDLKNMIEMMLIVDSRKRADIDYLLNTEIIRRKMKELGLDKIYKEKNIQKAFKQSGLLMGTIRIRDIKDINRKLPSQRYKPKKNVREEEMMENDEYETMKESFFKLIKMNNEMKPNLIKENKKQLEVIKEDESDNIRKSERKHGKEKNKEKYQIQEMPKPVIKDKESKNKHHHRNRDSKPDPSNQDSSHHKGSHHNNQDNSHHSSNQDNSQQSSSHHSNQDNNNNSSSHHSNQDNNNSNKRDTPINEIKIPLSGVYNPQCLDPMKEKIKLKRRNKEEEKEVKINIDKNINDKEKKPVKIIENKDNNEHISPIPPQPQNLEVIKESLTPEQKKNLFNEKKEMIKIKNELYHANARKKHKNVNIRPPSSDNKQANQPNQNNLYQQNQQQYFKQKQQPQQLHQHHYNYNFLGQNAKLKEQFKIFQQNNQPVNPVRNKKVVFEKVNYSRKPNNLMKVPYNYMNYDVLIPRSKRGKRGSTPQNKKY